MRPTIVIKAYWMEALLLLPDAVMLDPEYVVLEDCDVQLSD